MIKVETMQSVKNSGQTVKNQYVITDYNGDKYFQSYDTIVAKKDTSGNISINECYYRDSWISNTTLNYLRQFLYSYDSKKEIEKKISDGIYKLEHF